MKIPTRENFIEVLTFLHEYCKAPKERECQSCILYDNYDGCLLHHYPEYLVIDKIAELLYGKGGFIG